MKHNFHHSIISLKGATEKLRQGIEQGLYGPPYGLRMLQFNPTIISISEDHFQFGMYKHQGVFRARISPEIATHWGIELVSKKNCL
jgi:hypothetical protein